jgi:hypothetical protein
MRDTCRTCACYLSGGTYRGVCRRYPPVLLGHGPAFYPPCGRDDWCGEWRRIPAGEPSGTLIPATTVGDLALNVRVRHALRRRGFYADTPLDCLTRRSADILLQVKGIGKGALRNIRECLAQHGLTLKGEELSRQCPC